MNTTTITIDVEWLKFGWGVLVTLAGLGSSFVVLWASKHFVKLSIFDGALDSLRNLINGHGTRLTRIETDLTHVPTHADVTGIKEQVGDIAQRLSTVEGQNDRTNNLLSAIHEHLLNQKD